jgi:hypothetical protein
VKYVGDECAEEGLWLVALNQRDFKRAQTNERGIERKRKGFMIVIEYP